MNSFIPTKAKWFSEPQKAIVADDKVTITTDPGTDFWQRTYYGFRNDNAPVLYMPIEESRFTFTVRVDFNSSTLFDQCGIAIYQDSDNWFKCGLEYHTEDEGWLGSVVTNHGYSDWATTEMHAVVRTIWYRLSRRDADYLIEYSLDGNTYQQMRIFHLFEGAESINMGLMACSPMENSFDAVFSEMKMEACLWKAHVSG